MSTITQLREQLEEQARRAAAQLEAAEDQLIAEAQLPAACQQLAEAVGEVEKQDRRLRQARGALRQAKAEKAAALRRRNEIVAALREAGVSTAALSRATGLPPVALRAPRTSADEAA